MAEKYPKCERCGQYPCDEQTKQECINDFINHEDDIKEDMRID